jgi:tetratricopeptide (TPR) repeat protein
VPLSAVAQEPPQGVVAQANHLRGTGEFAAAAEILRRQLALEPDNGEVARLLAQTLYWMKDLQGAHAVYADALTRHPEDFALRLQYARMLAEIGSGDRARTLLMPLLDIADARAEAETLLGLLAYWHGDLSEARRRFDAALQANPEQPEAEGHLRDIRGITAPWIRVSSSIWHDNQPLDRLALGLEAGWFATPLTEVTARMQPARYRADDGTRSAEAAELAMTHVAAKAHLEAAMAAGAIRRSYDDSPWDWTGRASLSIRLPQNLTVRAQIERTPYFSTASSLQTPVMVRTSSGVVQRGGDLRGWLGQLAYERHRYPDGNTVQTAYGWLLAPLVRRDGIGIQIGYGFASSDADVSRFSPDGRYVPYYTPRNLERHSLLLGVTLGGGRPATVRVDASYGVRATDDAPAFVIVNGQSVPDTYRRTSSPWNVRTSIAFKLREGLTLEPKADFGRTVFYSWATASLQITYRLRAGVARPGGRRE